MQKISQGDMPKHENHTSLMTTSLTGSAEERDRCDSCGETGWITYDVPVGDTRFGRLFPCPACGPRRAAARARSGHAQRHAALARELGGKLARCSFSNFDLTRPIGGPVTWGRTIIDIDQQGTLLTQAHATCHAYAEAPTGWLYLYGTFGSGKSHLAAAVANHCTTHMGVTYSTSATVWNWLRAGHNTNDFDERLAALCVVDLLVLDDLNAERATEFVHETLFTIVNTRYNYERATVFTSNAGISQLPGRVASRVQEMAVPVFLAVADYRQQKGVVR